MQGSAATILFVKNASCCSVRFSKRSREASQDQAWAYVKMVAMRESLEPSQAEARMASLLGANPFNTQDCS